MRNGTLLDEYRKKFFKTVTLQVEGFMSRQPPKYLLEVTIKRQQKWDLPIIHFPHLEREYHPVSETLASHVTFIYPPNRYKEEFIPTTGRCTGGNRPQATNEPLTITLYNRIRAAVMEYPEAEAEDIARYVLESAL